MTLEMCSKSRVFTFNPADDFEQNNVKDLEPTKLQILMRWAQDLARFSRKRRPNLDQIKRVLAPIHVCTFQIATFEGLDCQLIDELDNHFTEKIDRPTEQ